MRIEAEKRDPLDFICEDGICNEINVTNKSSLVSKKYLSKLKYRVVTYYDLAYKRRIRINNLVDKYKDLNAQIKELKDIIDEKINKYNRLLISYNNVREEYNLRKKIIKDLEYELSLVYEQYETTNYHLGALYDQYDLVTAKHKPFINPDRHLRQDKVAKILEVYDGNMSTRVLERKLAEQGVKVSHGYITKFLRELKNNK